ncbi:DUF732 domain-containing protein [Nocardioides pakistanensis]
MSYRAVLALAVTVLVTAGCATKAVLEPAPPEPSGSQQVTPADAAAYLREVRRTTTDPVASRYGDRRTLEIGRSVCEALRSGFDPSTLRREVLPEVGYTGDDSMWVLHWVDQYLCPGAQG